MFSCIRISLWLWLQLTALLLFNLMKFRLRQCSNYIRLKYVITFVLGFPIYTAIYWKAIEIDYQNIRSLEPCFVVLLLVKLFCLVVQQNQKLRMLLSAMVTQKQLLDFYSLNNTFVIYILQWLLIAMLQIITSIVHLVFTSIRISVHSWKCGHPN